MWDCTLYAVCDDKSAYEVMYLTEKLASMSQQSSEINIQIYFQRIGIYHFQTLFLHRWFKLRIFCAHRKFIAIVYYPIGKIKNSTKFSIINCIWVFRRIFYLIFWFSAIKCGKMVFLSKLSTNKMCSKLNAPDSAKNSHLINISQTMKIIVLNFITLWHQERSHCELRWDSR